MNLHVVFSRHRQTTEDDVNRRRHSKGDHDGRPGRGRLQRLCRLRQLQVRYVNTYTSTVSVYLRCNYNSYTVNMSRSYVLFDLHFPVVSYIEKENHCYVALLNIFDLL